MTCVTCAQMHALIYTCSVTSTVQREQSIAGQWGVWRGSSGSYTRLKLPGLKQGWWGFRLLKCFLFYAVVHCFWTVNITLLLTKFSCHCIVLFGSIVCKAHVFQFLLIFTFCIPVHQKVFVYLAVRSCWPPDFPNIHGWLVMRMACKCVVVIKSVGWRC